MSVGNNEIVTLRVCTCSAICHLLAAKHHQIHQAAHWRSGLIAQLEKKPTNSTLEERQSIVRFRYLSIKSKKR